jgi:two-component system, OmpR family, sensor kinase
MTLKRRLVVVVLLTGVLLAAAGLIVVVQQRASLIRQIDRDLDNAAPVVVLADGPLLPGDPPEVGPGPPPDAPPDAPISDVYVGVLDSDGAQIDLIVGALLGGGPELSRNERQGLVEDTSGGGAVRTTTADERYRLLAVPVARGEVLLVAKPLDNVDSAIGRLIWLLGAAALAVMVALALMTWWVVRLGLRPIAQMTSTATELAAGDRSQRVRVDHSTTEAGQLAVAFNEMLDQRDAAEARLRQFVADASHELRTPLTSIRGYLDLMQQGAFSDDRLDDVLRRMSSESRRMHGLVDDLLLLEQLDRGTDLARIDTDLAEVVRDEANSVRALQPARPISVSTPDQCVARVDDRRIRQIVGNLVHNAIAHTPHDTAVTLRVHRSAAEAVIEVTDAGPGMDADTAAHAFDRFRRGDPSRSRHTGGAGLGLAIARSLAEAHGGTLTLRTAPGEGCTFTLRVPA